MAQSAQLSTKRDTTLGSGCRTCKVRRVKCDRAQPTCQRCIKSRRICVKASAKNDDLSILVENQYASGIIKRPRGPRPSLGAALNLDLQTRARIYYLNYHLQTPLDVQKLLGSVQDSVCQWASVTKYSIIDLAISSMALAIFSRTQQHPQAAAEACEKYDRLLRIAQVSMEDLVQRDIDAALLAIFLMSRYEDSMHTPNELLSTPAFKSYSHHDGATATLKIWEERCVSDNPPATAIIKHSRRGIIRSALLRHMAVPVRLADGSRFGEYGLELEYDHLLVGVASLRHRFKRLQWETLHRRISPRERFASAQGLRIEADVLNKSLQDWATRIPGTWCPRRHLIPAHYPLPRKHFFSSVVYSYASIAYAAVWLNYFATSMLLNRARLRILELIRPLSDDLACEQQRQEEDCCSQITAMAGALSSSIPFALDRFTVADSRKPHDEHAVTLTTDEEVKPYLASLTAWPLSLASSIEGLDVKLKDWFKSELSYVGRIVGAGVLECVHSYDRFDF